MASEYERKLQYAESVVNIARIEVELAQSKLKKVEAMYDVSKMECCIHGSCHVKHECKLPSARVKLLEAEVEIENAEVALRAAQDSIQLW